MTLIIRMNDNEYSYHVVLFYQYYRRRVFSLALNDVHTQNIIAN